jgi:hypothetical protein
VRDSWEKEKDVISSKIANLLGESYTLDVDMHALYPYATSGYSQTRPGGMTKDYFDAFVDKLEYYVRTYGDDGKTTFNKMVTTKKISLEIDGTGRFSYCGCDIKEGRFRILAAEEYLGTNIYDACQNMIKAVEDAEASGGEKGLSVGAKANVKETVDKEFPTFTSQFSEILGTKITLDANLESNYKKISGVSSYSDAILGTVTVAYFQGFVDNLTSLKFKGDDMMQEAFQDACSKGTIRLEVVDALKHGTYNDVIFEDGICKLQVSPP